MREHSRDRGRLEEILKHGQNVAHFVEGITFDDFVKDLRIYYATMKNIEVIGEAANMLTRHFREVHAELPWRQIIGMRNVLVHGYAQVSGEDLWQTASNDILPLCEKVKHYLAIIDWDAWSQTSDPYSEMDNAAYKQAVETASRMLIKDYTISEISELTGLTVEEVTALTQKK